MPPTLALIHQLAAAIEAADADQTFAATADLAEILGLPTAVAIAQAMARELAPAVVAVRRDWSTRFEMVKCA